MVDTASTRALITYDPSIERDVYNAYKEHRADIKAELRKAKSKVIMKASEQRNEARERVMEYDYPFLDHYTIKHIVSKFEPLKSSYHERIEQMTKKDEDIVLPHDDRPLFSAA